MWTNNWLKSLSNRLQPIQESLMKTTPYFTIYSIIQVYIQLKTSIPNIHIIKESHETDGLIIINIMIRVVFCLIERVKYGLSHTGIGRLYKSHNTGVNIT